MSPTFRYRLHGLAMDPLDPSDPVEKALRDWHIDPQSLIQATITRESVDARKASHPVRRYTLELVTNRPYQRRMLDLLADPVPDTDDLLAGSLVLGERIHVVGSGPCGIACAIALAQKGYRVVLHERGADLATRSLVARRFIKGADLDPETNFLFGEGGAGTFTDGKLTTRTRNRLVLAALQQWVDVGEDPAILWRAKPHLGTDRMRVLVAGLRQRFEGLGGQMRFLSRLEDLEITQGRLTAATFSGVSESVDTLVLAIGHSARDTAEMLAARGVMFEAKDFAMGVRIEHPQELIDRRQYGSARDVQNLGAAEYSLACKSASGPGAHSFCMCPGGEVLPTTTNGEELATNGMSFRARAGRWANSGLVVPVHRDQMLPWAASLGIPDDLWTGVRLQQRLERDAYAMGGGGFRAPAQRAADYLDGLVGDLPETSYARGLAPVDLATLLPDFMAQAIAQALFDFDRKIPGFIRHGVMIAPETRTSSPLRIPRDPSTLAIPGIEGLYALGEGAGWSGGIVTSAADGLRLADRAVAHKV